MGRVEFNVEHVLGVARGVRTLGREEFELSTLYCLGAACWCLLYLDFDERQKYLEGFDINISDDEFKTIFKAELTHDENGNEVTVVKRLDELQRMYGYDSIQYHQAVYEAKRLFPASSLV